jgi:small subunit ribosomal protein S9
MATTPKTTDESVEKKPAKRATAPRAKKKAEEAPAADAAVEAKSDAKSEVPAKAGIEAKAAKAESAPAMSGPVVSTVGRRKTAVARVRLSPVGTGKITVNGKAYDKFFTVYELREQVASALKAVGREGSVDVSAKVVGGGMRGQAEAVRHGISRALVVLDENNRKSLKKQGFLTRDPRKRERKKFGLKGARRSPQWSKR